MIFLLADSLCKVCLWLWCCRCVCEIVKVWWFPAVLVDLGDRFIGHIHAAHEVNKRQRIYIGSWMSTNPLRQCQLPLVGQFVSYLTKRIRQSTQCFNRPRTPIMSLACDTTTVLKPHTTPAAHMQSRLWITRQLPLSVRPNTMTSWRKRKRLREPSVSFLSACYSTLTALTILKTLTTGRKF